MAAGSAHAARVIVLGRDGHATVRDDRYLTGPAVTPTPAGRPAATAPRRGHRRRAPAGARRLRRGARHAGAASTLRRHLRARLRAISREPQRCGPSQPGICRGPRAHELNAVLLNIHEIAVTGALTASRLPALFLTLDRNLRWWTRGPLLDASQRVEFAGSELVWQYYPGQGLELQELGSFGKADGLYTGAEAGSSLAIDSQE